MRLPRLSYANVMATLAFFLACGGMSYAAASLPANSVGTKQLENGAVTLAKIAAQTRTALHGADGKTVLNGAGAPSSAIGSNGDFYIDTAADALYGPRTSSGWGSATSLIGQPGQPGQPGQAGADGKTVLNGAGAPSSAIGSNGDFYIDTAADALYGPRTSSGWGSATSLIGQPGQRGPAGLTNDTYFTGDGVTNQPNGQDRAVLTATGLAAGTYLVTFRMYIYPAQRFFCGVANGSIGSTVWLPTYRTTNSGGNPETFESTGVMTVPQSGQSQVLYCNGFTSDWSASNPEIHFIKIDTQTLGTTG